MCTEHYARFTFADLTPRLGSGVVEGKSGQNHRPPRRDPFTLAEWRAMRVFASVGTVKESHVLQLPLKDSCIVHV